MIETDYRIGGLPVHYIASQERTLMNVPDEIRKCVVFLAYDHPSEGEIPVGTGFFVSLREGFSYLVTAAHVIEMVRDVVKTGDIHVRVNTHGSGVTRIKTNAREWRFHPTDPIIDVAVLPWTWSDSHDALTYPVESIATKEVMEKEGIGLGDELFMAGLYARHYGKSRNIPIIRIGNLAATPEEPANTKRGPMEGYLAEVRSIGGLSGSPVFVHADAIRTTETGKVPRRSGFYLLGLMHGHWDIKHLAPVMFEIDSDYLKQPLNSGIGVVVPIEKILEVIHQPSEIERRKAELERTRLGKATTED